MLFSQKDLNFTRAMRIKIDPADVAPSSRAIAEMALRQNRRLLDRSAELACALEASERKRRQVRAGIAAAVASMVVMVVFGRRGN